VTEKWDEELLRDQFNQADVSDILSIPVITGMNDEIAWHYDHRGIFQLSQLTNLAFGCVTEHFVEMLVHLPAHLTRTENGNNFGARSFLEGSLLSYGV
jgi:hypothetical protein